jgi:hypothetical protein
MKLFLNLYDKILFVAVFAIVTLHYHVEFTELLKEIVWQHIIQTI